MGLAPLVVERLLVALRDAAARGTGVLFVEQYARRALAAADRAYVMRRGGIAVSGSAAALLQDFDRAVRPHLTASAVPDAVAG
jgi:ABC-type branched-subunit amino acid transport system ATPase component